MSSLAAPPLVAAQTVPSPPFYTDKKAAAVSKRHVDVDLLKTKMAWDAAVGPAKLVPMNLFMSYMLGTLLQMIPITMTFMLFLGPLAAIARVGEEFARFRTDKNGAEILLYQAVYIACQLAVVAIGVWKVNAMGLIPNSTSDWLAWETVPAVSASVL